MDAFVARQPIFDVNLKVVGYELLFRNNLNNHYDSTNAEQSTLNVITNGFILIGLEKLTDGKKAFINFPDSLLKKEIAVTLPRDIIVVEILEDVVVDENLLIACNKLKYRGYELALDDFVFHPKYNRLLDLVDIIKIDFRITQGEERKNVIKKYGNKNIKFLAEKVETMEEFTEAVKDGYKYFQGYFFSKPVILTARNLMIYKNNHMMLLDELSKPEVDFNKLENIIKQDVSLSYKLLRFINSASFGFKTKIDSIRHALLLLGKDDLVKWTYLIMLNDTAEKKPDELMRLSVVRGKFGELIASKINVKERASDIFFMGILSLIDAITNMPMKEVLEQMPIAEDIKNALLGEENFLRDVYELIISYERADWDKFSIYAKKMKINELEIPQLYIKTMEWVNEVYKE